MFGPTVKHQVTHRREETWSASRGRWRITQAGDGMFEIEFKKGTGYWTQFWTKGPGVSQRQLRKLGKLLAAMEAEFKAPKKCLTTS